jgi:hypothetical protein
MSFQSRAYQGEDDYQKIRAMLSDICRLADGTGSSPGISASATSTGGVLLMTTKTP